MGKVEHEKAHLARCRLPLARGQCLSMTWTCGKSLASQLSQLRGFLGGEDTSVDESGEGPREGVDRAFEA